MVAVPKSTVCFEVESEAARAIKRIPAPLGRLAGLRDHFQQLASTAPAVEPSLQGTDGPVGRHEALHQDGPARADGSTLHPGSGAVAVWHGGGRAVENLGRAAGAAVGVAAARAGVEEGTSPAEINCVLLVEALLERLYPVVGSGGRVPSAGRTIRPGATVDDLGVGSRGVLDSLVPGGWWSPVASMDQIVAALGEAGPGSAAVLVEQGGGEIGHALLYAHAGADGETGRPRIMRVDPQASRPVEMVTGVLPRWVWAGRGTRMAVIDPSGQSVDPATLPAEPQSASLAQALVDAPTSHGYGMIGMELETDYMSLGHKEDLASSAELNLVMDRSLDGRSIIEIVTEPVRVLAGEAAGREADEVFGAVQRLLERLGEVPSGQKARLSHVLPEDDEYTVMDRAGTVVGKGNSHGAEEKLAVHFTVGVPLAGLREFLVYLERAGRARTVQPVIRIAMNNLAHGLRLGDLVKEDFLESLDRTGPELVEDAGLAADADTLAGHMALVYTHLTAFLRASYAAETTSRTDLAVTKNFTPVLSCTWLSTVLLALGDRPKNYLASNAGNLISAMERHFVQSNRAAAVVLGKKFIGSPQETFIDVFSDDAGNTLRSYLGDALDPAYAYGAIDPDKAFRKVTSFPEMDRTGIGVDLVLLELRFFGPEARPDLDTARGYFEEIAARLRVLYDRERDSWAGAPVPSGDTHQASANPTPGTLPEAAVGPAPGRLPAVDTATAGTPVAAAVSIQPPAAAPAGGCRSAVGGIPERAAHTSRRWAG